MKLKDYIKLLVLTLVIILIFTAIDAIFHIVIPEFAVPSWYFRNKIIYGTLIGFISLIFLRKKKIFIRSLLFSAIVTVPLQIRYAYYGYPLYFHLFFIPAHFLILLGASYIIFKKFLK